MSVNITVGKYTFSSWLRKGIGALVTEADHLGSGTSTTKERARVQIDVTLNSENVHKEFALLGPGDIIGINAQLVVRTEPLNWVTDFEPNYLAFIEFYDEDFLWRYTPARANGERLRPWLALLVLEEGDAPGEGEFTKNDKRLPLPSVTVNTGAALPPHDQTWAWGHVHINEGYNTATEFEQFLLSLHDLNHPNSDKIICRLLSPRKLKENAAYRAFVVPAFETGRLAGLGQDVSEVDAQQPSWDGSGSVELPVFYDWYFRTGQNEDFESLVKKLEPRPVDRRVGIRDMDGSRPGFGMVAGTDIGPVPPLSDNQAVIGLEGALKSPQTRSRPEAIDPSRPFFHELESILNFPAQLRAATNASTDPVVAPPIYGENHAMRHEIEASAGGWLNDMNRDPRNRVPSGFGTNVVQKHQEDYVARAWEQVTSLAHGNRRIRFSVFAMAAVQTIQTNFVARLQAPELLAIFSPVMKKVKGSPTTLYHQLENSNIPTAAVNSALRRMIRPRGAYGKRLRQADTGFSHAGLIEDLNEGRVSAAPPKQVPPPLVTDERVADRLPGSGFPGWLKFLLKQRLVVLIILLALLLFLGLATGAWLLCGLVAAAVVGVYLYAGRWVGALRAVEMVRDAQTVLSDLQSLGPRPDFRFKVTDPVTPVTPVSTSAGTDVSTSPGASSSSVNALHFTNVEMYTRTAEGQDSLEAKSFRTAAINLNRRLSVKAPEREVARIDMENAYQKLLSAVDPAVAFPKLVASQVRFTFDPGWLLDPEHLIPAMAYPDFPDPMYKKLRDISSELFLPNLHLIPPNTISLLVTNPRFIESYMAGLNHEFGRELLWREYPTDQRGSYFRQFWDVKGIITASSGLTVEELADLAEEYKDIMPLDEWTSASALGTHRNPQRPPGEQIVLMVRGDLLKKYPNTIIYAQKAHIFRDALGVRNASKEPVIIEVKTEAEMNSEIRFPLFHAEIDPDIRFFGFDMNASQARGDDDPKLETDDWGWYFIIQQLPGEPRFGMDVTFVPDEEATTPVTWDDLAWNRISDSQGFINTATPPVPQFFNLLSAPLKSQWGRHSADMAFILYQKPVMIAVHAREMLENV